MDVLARMLPTKPVAVPTVALLPTCQVTLLLLHGVAPFTSTTAALLAVVSELVIWKSHAALGLVCASRVRVPVSCAEELKQYTPGGSDLPPRSWPLRF